MPYAFYHRVIAAIASEGMTSKVQHFYGEEKTEIFPSDKFRDSPNGKDNPSHLGKPGGKIV